MEKIPVTVDPAREVAEIANDFTRPIEVLREAIHNSYDANAELLTVVASVETTVDNRRVLTLTIRDDGDGMTRDELKAFFGLGFSIKKSVQRRIGNKGHGTKIYYQARDIHLVTRTKGKPLVYARVLNAREAITAKREPTPEAFFGTDAEQQLTQANLPFRDSHGTFLQLIDYTAESNRLIDDFTTDRLINYFRWFTVYGSFQHVVNHDQKPTPPFELRVQGTDKATPEQVPYGHPWPHGDQIKLATLRKLDERRPYNWFQKTLRFPNLKIAGGYTIDIAILFEGKHARMKRDDGIARQKIGGQYSEEERYGVWLCRDYIPIEYKPEWLLDEECPMVVPDLRRPLIMVNCQQFKLIANRGSVGNSEPQLLLAIKDAVFNVLKQAQDDKDIANFLREYQEDMFSRIREKDKKALDRRIERYNRKEQLEIKLAKGKKHRFWEPQREITLFGLVAELNLLEPTILGFEILDYDDHMGIDLLVLRNGSTTLLDKQKVAYIELKYMLENQVNHAFDHLSAIVCWQSLLNPQDMVTDAAGSSFALQEHQGPDGVTYSQLVPKPGSSITHNVRVIVLKRLLQEKYQLTTQQNPRPIKK